jgi:hypothetical protein
MGASYLEDRASFSYSYIFSLNAFNSRHIKDSTAITRIIA